LNGNVESQLLLDFRTGRPTYIHGSELTDRERSACAALNRQRASGIQAAAEQATSGEPVSANVWAAAITGRALELEVPIIPVSAFALPFDEAGLVFTSTLKHLGTGAEASAWFDTEQNCVYKLFELTSGSFGSDTSLNALGKKITLTRDEDGQFDLQNCDANLFETMEKICVLHEAGAHFTEIVGLLDTGAHFLVKQPLAFEKQDYEADRAAALNNIKAISPVARMRRRFGVIWLGGKAWIVGDLHERNIMRDAHGNPTIIDALVGAVSPAMVKELQWLSDAIEDAQALREGKPLPKRKAFEDVNDDEL
jgi:hypothetical protein